MNIIHPTISAALAPFAPKAQANATDAYVEALKKHDWTFEYADDSKAYHRGHKERQDLLAMRPICDPDWVLWNEHAPYAYQVRR